LYSSVYKICFSYFCKELLCEESFYQGRILDGIHLHRNIDSFTDSHPASLELRRILRKRHGKYAPVVVDLIWDYFLSINWTRFHGSKLPDFNADIYEVLIKRKDELPAKLKSRIDKMVENDFLMAYASKENMMVSLNWMDNRVKFKSAFTDTIKDIEENQQVIETLFNSFFPELISYSETFCNC